MEDHIDSRYDAKTLGEILSAFRTKEPLRLENLDGENPLAKIGRACEDLFTSGVIALRKSGNPIISDLMADVWDIFHYRHVVMAIGPNVPSLAISVIMDHGVIKAITFAPWAWPLMVKEDPSMELGSIIVVGSQVVDFYNNKILAKEDSIVSKQRSLAYEAEYLLALRNGGHNLNGYQLDVLEKYPNGFDSSFAYPRKAVVVPGSAS
jgi:hypothetical protein